MLVNERALTVCVLAGVAMAARGGHLGPLPADPAHSPCIVLEAEPGTAVESAGGGSVAVCHADLTEHDATRSFVHGNTLVLPKPGHAHASATLRFKLPNHIEPGVYSLWTCFTIGGVATQRFEFRAGVAPGQLVRTDTARISRSGII